MRISNFTCPVISNKGIIFSKKRKKIRLIYNYVIIEIDLRPAFVL